MSHALCVKHANGPIRAPVTIYASIFLVLCPIPTVLLQPRPSNWAGLATKKLFSAYGGISPASPPI
jgi:hypothetical protein